MPKPWICEGIAKDGQEHDNQTLKGKHEPYENFGDDCVICNLTRDQVVGDTSSSGLPIKPLVFGAVALLVLGGGGWYALGPCGDGQVRSSPIGPCVDGNSNDEDDQNNGDEDITQERYSWEPERFTWGQQTLFPGVGNQLRDQGMEAFKQGDYSEASQLFKRAIEGNRNDPEPLIFYNNALAQQKGEPLTLAVVVPVDSRENSAKEMLRGVAQAQDEFNAQGGLDGRLLEIVVANDGNDPETASKIAQALSDDPTILGVIGHNSSNASKAGLEIYEQAGLPMISPTSTSTELEGDLFFRTVPSDAAAAEKLANYASSSLGIAKAVIFYNPESSFSTSLKEAFEARFNDLGGEVVAKDMTDPDLNAGIEVATSISDENAEAILLFPNTDYTSVAIELARANAQLGG
jgi:branched-chain amino acid transport system substrate-binding protein